jgi:hypothetical protein
MGVATRAGAFYAIIVFLIGFIFGSIRVLLLAPRLGETGAVSGAEPWEGNGGLAHQHRTGELPSPWMMYRRACCNSSAVMSGAASSLPPKIAV